MYEAYFGLTERPFSIAPDPQYLYMSSRHQEAMAHLSYGLTQGGCFIVLTGEVGTGKTTLCRNLLGELPDNLDVALVLNANINEQELLQTVCDELKIAYQQDTSQKQLLDLINHSLLETFAQNRHTVLIIDEAQLLSRDVLEQIRLLTNLETTKSKLLQIILIGQPELNDLLSRNDLRQLAHRVTARYHLGALRRNEIEDYIHFRLNVAGCKKPLFSKQALSRLHTMTEGIPRRINVLADHALLAAYSNDQLLVDAKMVKAAGKDVFIESVGPEKITLTLPKWLIKPPKWLVPLTLLALLNVGLWWYFFGSTNQAQDLSENVEFTPSVVQADVSKQTLDPGGEVQGKMSQVEQTLPLSAVVEQWASVDVSSGAVNPVPESIQGNVDDGRADGAVFESSSSSLVQPGIVIVADELLDSSAQLSPSLDLPPSIGSGPAVVTSVDTSAGTPGIGAGVPLNRLSDTSRWRGSDLAQLLETSADMTGGIAAARELAGLWQFELPEQLLQSACDVVAQNGLRCLSFSFLEQVERFNRPAIVVLRNNDQLYRVVLQSLGSGTATLRIGSSNIVISKAELEDRWAEGGVLYWRPDQVNSRFLQLGDVGGTIVSVRNLLNRILSASGLPLLNSLTSSEFDLDMSQKVFALQTRFGIASDSKIGNETYMLINEFISPNVTPVLVKRLR